MTRPLRRPAPRAARVHAGAHTGGCLCGRVRYRVVGRPLNVVHCHFTMCRRASGAAAMTWASFARQGFAFTAGRPAVYKSSPKARRRFCRHCGTQLSFEYTHQQDEIDLSLGSLDRPERVRPRQHVWTSTRLGWLTLDPDLPVRPEPKTKG